MGPLVRKVCCFGQSKGILLGTERAPRADKVIDRKKAADNHVLTDEERKERRDSGRQMAMLT